MLFFRDGSDMSELMDRDVVTIPNFLKENARNALLYELQRRDFVPAPPVHGRRNVTQAFSRVESFDSCSLFSRAARELELWLECECVRLSLEFPQCLDFNDLVVQRYQPCDIGISPHHDGSRYISIIAIVVLEGNGDFCVCDDEDGTNPRSVRNEPGDVILMRGAGFPGLVHPPYHYVRDVRDQRVVFTLRHDIKR